MSLPDFLSSSETSDTFWYSRECYVATNPHDPDAALGLVEFVNARPDLRELGLLFFQTSGSEGKPKWVGISRAAFQASAHAVNEHLEITAKDRWLIPLPLHHVGGFSILARCFNVGSSFYKMDEKWDAGRFVQLCEVEKITLTSLVPTQVFDLVKGQYQAPNSMRAVVVGGGALGKEIGLRASELGWPILQSYGMTETSSQVATEPLAHLDSGFDPEMLEILPIWNLQTDEQNRLIVRGKGLASGYASLQDSGWQWDAIDTEEGLRTRDAVSIWEHGTRRFLRFVGREASFVKVKGELLHIGVLQERINTFCVSLGIWNRVIICPVPDERRDTKLVLVTERNAVSTAQLETLLQTYHQTSAPHEKLHEYVKVETLPVSDLGKISLAKLQQLVVRALEKSDV